LDTLNISTSRTPRLALVAGAAFLIGAAIAGCGGSESQGDGDIAVSVDTSAMSGSDGIADAVAAEHGAPGENEPRRIVLTGSNATLETVNTLKARGFTDVQLGAR